MVGGRRTVSIQESSLYFLARDSRGQRHILTDQMGYWDHAETKNLFWLFRRLRNILNLISEAKGQHPTQERSAMVMVWTNFRIIVANTMTTSFHDISELSTMASQDLGILAEVSEEWNCQGTSKR